MEAPDFQVTIMFNLIEISQKNTLQVREKITDNYANGGKAMSRYHRYTTDSRQDLSQEPKLVQDLAKAFPFIEEHTHQDGAHDDIALIRVMASDQGEFRYDKMVHVVKDGVTIASERKRPEIVKKGDDISTLPEKVQKVARLLFLSRGKYGLQKR